MKIKLYLKFTSFLFLVLFLSCRISSKSRGGKQFNNNKYIVEFYKKNNEFIYFVNPIEFKSENLLLKSDFTFTKRNDSLIDSVIFNYTFISNDKLSKDSIKDIFIDSILISNSQLIYNEIIKNQNCLRFGSKISVQNFKKINKSTLIKLKSKDKEIVFLPANSFCLKSLENLSELNKIK